MSLKQDFLSIFPTQMTDMKLDPTSLKFEQAKEQQYWTHNIEKTLSQKRVAMVIGVLIYLALAVADLVLAPALKDFAWMMRFGLFVPAALATFIFSYQALARQYLHLAVAILMLFAGLLQLVILWQAPAEVALVYCMALILIIVYNYTILATDFRLALVAQSATLIGFAVYLFSASPLTSAQRVVVFVIAALAYLLGAWVNYLMIYNSKRNYFINNQTTKTSKRDEVSTSSAEKTTIKKVESPINKMFDSIMDVVWFIDLNGEIKYISQSVKEFLGYEPDELIGKRALLLMPVDQYNEFERNATRLYKDLNLVQDIYEYKTKAGLIKRGESIIKAYSDRKLGEGYIGSTRPITDQVAIAMDTDAKQLKQLKSQVEGLDLDNRSLNEEVTSLREKLVMINQAHDSADTITRQELIDWLNQYNGDQAAYLSAISKEHRDQLRLLAKKFDNRTMGKYDLQAYVSSADLSLSHTIDYFKLLDSHQLIFIDIHKNSDQIIQNNYNIRTLLEENVIELRYLFEKTEHVIEINCQKSLEFTVDQTLFKHVLHNMIMQSLLKALTAKKMGKLTIDVEQSEDSTLLTIRDNGKLIEVDVVEQALAELLAKGDQTTVLPLVNRLLQTHFNGNLKRQDETADNHYLLTIN